MVYMLCELHPRPKFSIRKIVGSLIGTLVIVSRTNILGKDKIEENNHYYLQLLI